MSSQLESPPIPASLKMAIEVERNLHEQQVDIFFVMPRVVRRVLQAELDIASPWQPPPHRKCCVIQRDRLLWFVARDELGVNANDRLPEQLILIAQPELDELATMTQQELQRYYWRLMFHARIDYAMAARTRRDQMSPADLRRNIDRIGQTAFDEIRSVLRAEQMLMHPDDDRNVYAEFVAVYQEFLAFAPQMASVYFPSLDSRENVLGVIGPECDAQELLSSTCPSDLSLVEAIGLTSDEFQPSGSRPVREVAVQNRSARRFNSLCRKAEKLSLKENNVRAALVLQKALDFAPEESIPSARALLEAEIHKLVDRLQSALELSDDAARPWLTMCEKLLPNAQQGFWNPNARLLYDLQNACFDHEHVTYKVDLLKWALSFGKSPLKRPLSNQRVVLMSKHLRSSKLRVPKVEIDPEGRRELGDLLHEAADAAEHILRARLEPLIEQALVEAGFIPSGVVERVAVKKMTRELADGVVDRGFITLGSLRDAVSRNQLKMPDLTDAKEFISGDPLLRADRLMSASLDGVYPRGPFYLRWLQKLNSLAYGIPNGRMLTRYVALPFGLAFLLLKTVEVALEHLPVIHGTPSVQMTDAAAETLIENETQTKAVTNAAQDASHAMVQSPDHSHVEMVYTHERMFLLGCLIFALIHFPPFRDQVVRVLRNTWTGLRILLVDIPRAVLRWQLIDRLFKSFPMMLFRRFVLAPIVSTFVAWKLFPWVGLYRHLELPWGLVIFLLSFLVLNSRIGRDTEELAREFFARTWYHIRIHLLMGVLTLVIDIFRAMMDGLERVLYAVDEWLRYRSGESNLTLGIKAVFGLLWSIVHGVIRFCVTLLIEPQLNPIKHFPVVTVSHKIMFAAAYLPLGAILYRHFDVRTAELIRWMILFGTPGVFGFLAWELKENWKLYKANRSPRLKPVLIGDHGETLLRLLCPGFHSGTIPRLFAKQRRAALRGQGRATDNRHAKFIERLHHESTAVRHFIERELIELLGHTRTFRDLDITVEEVRLTTNRVLVTLNEASSKNESMKIEFAEQSGWLVGVVRDPGWLNHLEPDDAQVFKAALTGLYKLAAVDLVREQIEEKLAMASPRWPNSSDHSTSNAVNPYDIGRAGLVVWPNGVYETEAFYPLDEQPVSHPRPRSVARATGLEPILLAELVFQLNELTWEEWQRFWENEQNLPAHSVSKFPFQW